MLSDKPWKGSAVLRLLLALVVSMWLGMLAIGWLDGGRNDAGAKFTAFIVGTISFHGIGLLLVGRFVREHGMSWGEAFGFKRSRLGRALLLGLIAGLLVLPIAWSLSQLSAKVLTWFQFTPVIQQAVQTLQTADSWTERIYFGVVAVLVAPAVEEMVFRGILYPALKRARLPGYAWLFRWRVYPRLRRSGWRRAAIWVRCRLCPQLQQGGQPRFALWTSSLLFAATHGNLMTFVPLTFLAVVLVLLYESTDNLIAPILTHSFFNGANYFWLLASG